MVFLLKRFLSILIFNSVLFLILIVGIQNSTNKKKVNLLFGETVSLPISFIVGVSFISGSLTGGFTANSLIYKRNNV